MPTDRVVVLRAGDPMSFLADACAAAADAVNETRAWRDSDTALIDMYAELVVAYARLTRSERTGARLAVTDHLMERVAQVRAGVINTPLGDIADRLHSELTALPASV